MEGEIVRSEVHALTPPVETGRTWTRERVDLVKRTICPKGITDDAFALFMEQCKRSGLDPLLKEAFCVPRRQKVGESWVEQHVFQPAEAGMLSRAERFPDFKGIQASAVYAEDEILVDQGAGTVTHRFNPAKRKGQLVGAWARVVRQDKLPVVVWLDFAGYVQQTPLWSKIPTTMIEKCARVAALRKAYPEAFGGLYIGEEMPQEVETATPSKSTQPDDAAPPPQKEMTSKARRKAPPTDSSPVGYGPATVKKKQINELSPEEAVSMLELGATKIAEAPHNPWWVPDVSATMAVIAASPARLSHEKLGTMLDTCMDVARNTDALPVEQAAASVLLSVLEAEAERRAKEAAQ